MAQVVGSELGVPVEHVRVVAGDTARIPHGVGRFASRAAVMAGNAVAVAAQRVRARAIQVAAHTLEVAPEDVEWRSGGAHVRGAGHRALSLGHLARANDRGLQVVIHYRGFEPDIIAQLRGDGGGHLQQRRVTLNLE